MKIVLDWKNLADVMPDKEQEIVARLRVTGVIVWFTGQYLGHKCSIDNINNPFYLFNGSKFNPKFFTKGHRQDFHLYESDLKYSFWDYYEPKWPLPKGYEDIEEVFYEF